MGNVTWRWRARGFLFFHLFPSSTLPLTGLAFRLFHPRPKGARASKQASPRLGKPNWDASLLRPNSIRKVFPSVTRVPPPLEHWEACVRTDGRRSHAMV